MDDLIPVDEENNDAETDDYFEVLNDEPKGEKNRKNGICIVCIGIITLWIGIAILFYSLIVGNASVLFTAASFIYPAGFIIFGLGSLVEVSNFAGKMKIVVFIGAVTAFIFGAYSLILPLKCLVMSLL